MQAVGNKEVVYEFGEFVVDPNEKTVVAGGIPIHLPAKEFETLLLLIENNRRALSKEEMLSAIWQDSFVEDGNLAKYVSRLRKLLETNDSKYIETIPKHGYRFSADLKLIAKPRDEALVIERQTVKRLTVSVEDGIDRELPAPLRATHSPNRWKLVALVLVAGVGATLLGFKFFRTDVKAVDPYEPVRLTESPYDDTGPVWTRDGRIRFHRIYFDNRTETWIMNADGGEQTQISFADGRAVLSWSPDEQRIQFLKQDDKTKVYVSNADGSGEVLLPNRGGRWSADSKMIASHQNVGDRNYDIVVYSVETGESRNLTNSPDFDADPSISSDGRKVLFTSGRDGNAEIYVMNIDGTGLQRLTFDPSTDSHASFSPDGTQILFTSDRENENSDVYIMNADGSDPVKFTNWDKSNETAGPGGWSPDGMKIAFFSDRNGKDDIYVANAETVRPKIVLSDADRDLHTPSFSPDGKRIVYTVEMEDKSGELRMLDVDTARTNLIRKTELPATEPAWSPDGKRVAFVDRIDGNSEVCAANPDGSGFANLTNNPSTDINPSWSPDGARLAFVSYRGEPRGAQLYTMNVDGGDPRPITPRKGWESNPVWSPDGAGIVFVCDRDDSPGNLLDICQVNADGNDEKHILFHRNHDTQPAVSPDGARIAFVALSDGNAEIYIMKRDGSGLRRLTRDPADDTSPNWSPDGRRLIFTSNRSGGKSAIYEIELR